MTVGLLSFASLLSGFNGGKTQIQSTVPNLSGDFPFINLLKSGDAWNGTISTNGGAPIDPSWLDANGYPLASALSGSAYMNIDLPNYNSRPANASNHLVITWVGRATILPENVSNTGGLNGTSGTSVLNGYGFSDGLYHGRYEWYPNNDGIGYKANGTSSFQLEIISIVAGNSVTNLQMFFAQDEAALLSGEMFGTQYKSVLKASGAGAFRFMDWLLTNIATTTTWASRKSLTAPSWSTDEYRASLYPGDIMTNTGNDYALTTGSFTLADRLTMHIHFNTNGTFKVNTGSGFSILGSPQTLTASLTPQLTIGWTSHGFSNGQMVGAIFSGNPPTGMQTGINYFVKVIDANTFQLALTSGGSAIAPASLGGSIGIVSMATLSLNGSAQYPIRQAGGNPWLEAVASVINTGSVKLYATVVFDATLGCWLMSGGTQSKFSSGLQNGIPIEVCLQLCKELGMHPFFSIPFLALDPMTDYVPSLANEIKTNWPSWMIPRFEPGNENWNPQTPCCNYALNKSWHYWQKDWPDWTGKTASTLGQAVAAVYGHGNLGTTYEVLAPSQTDDMSYPIPNPSVTLDPILTSAQFVANGPAQTGYTQTAASGWVSAALIANYITPPLYLTPTEWELAWDYYYTSIGNPTQQAADLNTYVDSLVSGTSTQGFSIAYVGLRWRGTADWASRFGITKVFGYEGGYSPDLTPTYEDTVSFNGVGGPQSGISCQPTGSDGFGSSAVPTKATSCVIDIRRAITPFRGTTNANPSVAGMLVYLSGVTGMTQLNCNSAGFNSVPPSFSSTVPDVTWTGHNLNVNQVVIFQGSNGNTANLPTNVISGQRYYVISTNLTANTFQFSATRGGSAVQANATVTTGITVYSAFVVLSTSTGSGQPIANLTAIDVDSTGFTTATSAPVVDFPNSLTLINNFRVATQLFATDLESTMLNSFTTFEGYGGSFMSQYMVSGSGNIWPPIQPDIWGTQGGSFAAIVAKNH